MGSKHFVLKCSCDNDPDTVLMTESNKVMKYCPFCGKEID